MSVIIFVTDVSRFVGDAAGLEKTLRLLQALAQVVAAYSLTAAAAAPWLQARKQFALGRRYLRFLKFIDAFTLASNSFFSPSGALAIVEFGKWSCLGMYLLLESCTILDAMGVVPTTWAPSMFVEAMKFWFYSLSLGIVGGMLELWNLRGPDAVVQKGSDGKDEKAAGIRETEVREKALKKRKIMKKVVIDGCDLFIPGSTTGWMETSSATVGMLSVVSSALAGSDIWSRLQTDPR